MGERFRRKASSFVSCGCRWLQWFPWPRDYDWLGNGKWFRTTTFADPGTNFFFGASGILDTGGDSTATLTDPFPDLFLGELLLLRPRGRSHPLTPRRFQLTCDATTHVGRTATNALHP